MMGLLQDNFHDFMNDMRGLLGMEKKETVQDTYSDYDPIGFLSDPECYQKHLYLKELESCRTYIRKILGRRIECEEVCNVICSLRENGIKNVNYPLCSSACGENFECAVNRPGYLERYPGKCLGMQAFATDAEFSYYIVFDVSNSGQLFFLSSDKQTEFRLEEMADTLKKAVHLKERLFRFQLGISDLERDIRDTMNNYKEKLRKEAYQK